MKRTEGARPWKHNQPEKLALFMWAQPSATEEEKAEHIGISRTTLWRYWKDKRFCKAVAAAADLMFEKAQPLVSSALVRKAISGDVAAIRLFFQLRGDLSEKQASSDLDMDVTVTIKRAQAD